MQKCVESMPKVMLSWLPLTAVGGNDHIGWKSRKPTSSGSLPARAWKSVSAMKPRTGCPCHTVGGALQRKVVDGRPSGCSTKICHLGR